MAELLTGVGKIAGIGGIALGVCLLIFREIIRKNIFPMMNRQQGFRTIRMLLIMTTVIVIAGIAAWTAGEFLNAPKASQTTTGVGDCNFAVQAQAVEGATVNVGQISCSSAPSAQIRITYYWMDSASYSSLSAGKPFRKLVPLVGSAPTVIKNTVYDSFADLVSRFGEQRESSPGLDSYSTEIVSPGAEALPPQDRALNDDHQDIEPFRQYGATRPFFVADPDAWQAVHETLYWPADYKQFYSGEFLEEDPNEDGAIIGSTVNWRPFGPEEAANYDTLVQSLADRIGSRSAPVEILYPADATDIRLEFSDALRDDIGADENGEASDDAGGLPNVGEILQDDVDASANAESPITSETASDVGGALKDGSDATGSTEAPEFKEARVKRGVAVIQKAALSNALAAMKYIAREGWPRDFLTAFGVWDSHGGEFNNWSVVVVPRAPYVLVAVIDVVGPPGASLTLSKLTARTDGLRTLREAPFDQSKGMATDIPIPALTLSGSERVVVPLRIEFRHPTSYGYIGREDIQVPLTSSDQAYERMQTQLQSRGLEDVLSWGTVRKTRSSFGPPQAPVSTPSYTYGIALTPLTAEVNNQSVSLRPFDPASVFVRAGYAGGSCPTLFVRRESAPDLLRLKHVLTQAVGASRQQEEVVSLGSGVVSVTLREEEPEISYIQSVEIRESQSGRLVARAGPFKLKPGEEIDIPVPAERRNVALDVKFTGYYVPLSSAGLQ